VDVIWRAIHGPHPIYILPGRHIGKAGLSGVKIAAILVIGWDMPLFVAADTVKGAAEVFFHTLL
jgi:hypothetical protein